MKSKQETVVKMTTIIMIIRQAHNWLQLCHQQQIEQAEQIKQNSENLLIQNSIYENQGFISGYSIALRLLDSIDPEMDLLLALKGIISFLEDNIYIESADLIDGDKNGSPEIDPEYFFTLRGKCYAYAEVSFLISTELKRISQLEMASDTTGQ